MALLREHSSGEGLIALVMTSHTGGLKEGLVPHGKAHRQDILAKGWTTVQSSMG